MERGRQFVCNRVEGEIQYNAAEFAEAQTNGIEGIENNLILGTIQIHREDTDDTKSEFEHRFPVGMWIGIVITTEISAQPTDACDTEKPN